MKCTVQWTKAILVIFGILTIILLITSIIFPKQRFVQFIFWYRIGAALQILYIFVCLRLIHKLKRIDRFRKENMNLKGWLK